MSNTPAEVAARVARVRETITETARRCGRRSEEITLIAVTKYAAPDEGFVEALTEAGCFDLAENRPQKLREKIDAAQDERIRWHLIGTLQKNKVKMVVGRAALIHSVDSLALAEEIARLAPPAGVDALVQVKISGEETKHGLSPEETLDTVGEMLALAPKLRVRGLMGMAALEARPDEIHRQFALLRSLRDQCQGAFGPAFGGELSMGMSDDYPIAIEEGATMLRIGSAFYDFS